MGDWQELIWILKQPFDRNGLFFVGTLTARPRTLLGHCRRGDSIPIVLLMNRTMYDEDFFRWAGDLADCLLAALSLD